MALSAGTRLGAYEILEPLGAGGMGEVYRATDTTLGRDVAIKVLPAVVADDAECLARFRREARLLASLNHPNIAHVYGFESATLTDGRAVHFLAMELVGGEDLAQRLRRGRVSVDEAVAIARQVAEGLEEAHERGVVHRDLKPANVKLTPDGKAKLLDFGLAKAYGGEPPAGSSSELSGLPTLSRTGTQAGAILGTAAYMSPEQARGRPIDKRTDIWSFGVLVFEMLTCERLFAGPTASDILASVLREDVPWTRLPPDTPRRLVRVLRRCLVRDPRDRLRDIGDARLDLAASEEQDVGPRVDGETPLPRRPLQLGWPAWAWAVAALVLAAALLTVWAPWRSAPTERAASLRLRPLSFEPGGQCCPVWSPDGKAVAFAAKQSATEPFQIYVRYLDSPVANPITQQAEGALPLGWTSGDRIVFVPAPAMLRTRGLWTQGLWSVSPVGGEPELLLGPEGGDGLLTASVSNDGEALALLRRGDDGEFSLWISSPPGAAPNPYGPAPFASTGVVGRPEMRFSPDGRQILLMRDPGPGDEAWLIPYPADPGRPPRRVLERLPNAVSRSFSWMPDSRRVVVSTSIEWSDPTELYIADTVSGAHAQLLSGTSSYWNPAVSPDGSQLIFVELTRQANVVSVDVATGVVTPLIQTLRRETMPAWAAGEAALVYLSDRNGDLEVWLHRPGQPERPLVTAREFPEDSTQWFMGPSLSPDATRLIYARKEKEGDLRLWMSSVVGGAPVPLVKGSSAVGGELPGSWSPDGRWYVYQLSGAGRVSLNKVKTTGQAEPQVLKADVQLESNWSPVWSPTGEWILHSDGGVRLTSPDGETTREVPTTSAEAWAFSADGRTLYGIREATGGRFELFSTNVIGGGEKGIAFLDGEYRPVSNLNPALRLSPSPDGRSLTYSTLTVTTSLWRVEGLDSIALR